MKVIYFTQLYQQDYGGDRYKRVALLHNNPSLHARFDNSGEPWYQGELLPYEVHQMADGSTYFDTSEESEYPRYFCECYAEVVEHTFRELSYQLLPREPSRQLGFFLEQLKDTTKRLQEESNQALVANELTAISALMWPGREQEHLRDMMRRIDHRGADVQLWAGELNRASGQLAPYPAFRWDWKVVASYPFLRAGHITELEMRAFLYHVRQEAELPQFFAKRFLHVLDSQVSTVVITKGRSSSRLLNFTLRECAALFLAKDLYPLVAWTLSKWNFSDLGSRIFQ